MIRATPTCKYELRVRQQQLNAKWKRTAEHTAAAVEVVTQTVLVLAVAAAVAAATVCDCALFACIIRGKVRINVPLIPTALVLDVQGDHESAPGGINKLRSYSVQPAEDQSYDANADAMIDNDQSVQPQL